MGLDPMTLSALFSAGLGLASDFLSGNASANASKNQAQVNKYGIDVGYKSGQEERDLKRDLANIASTEGRYQQQQQFGENEVARQFQNSESEKQRQYGQNQFNIIQNAYQELLKRGKEQSTEGENQVMGLTNNTLPELSKLENDIRNGQNQDIQRASNEFQSNLNKQGVRGTQAANLLSRYSGNLRQNAMKDVNQLAYEDALRRRDERLQVAKGKTSSGQKAYLTGVS